MSMLIPLTQGQFAIVDAADYDWLMDGPKWYATRDRNTFYARRNDYAGVGKQRPLMMHRLLTGVGCGMIVDHINHDGLDNRRANLRICTHSDNQRNVRSHRDAGSKYLGVHWNKNAGKWQVRIVADGRRKGLGYFTCEIEAALAYDSAARLHYGAFANPNFPLSASGSGH